jgi:hypothetical protein
VYIAAGVHVVLYIIFTRVGVAITVVSVAVAVAMTEVVRAKMATTQDVAVGRLGCDIAWVVVGGYLGGKSACYVPVQTQGRAR